MRIYYNDLDNKDTYIRSFRVINDEIVFTLRNEEVYTTPYTEENLDVIIDIIFEQVEASRPQLLSQNELDKIRGDVSSELKERFKKNNERSVSHSDISEEVYWKTVRSQLPSSDTLPEDKGYEKLSEDDYWITIEKKSDNKGMKR